MSTPVSVHILRDTITGHAGAHILSSFQTLFATADEAGKARLTDRVGHYVHALMILSSLASGEAAKAQSAKAIVRAFDFGAGVAWLNIVLPYLPHQIIMAGLDTAEISSETRQFFTEQMTDGIPIWPLFVHYIATDRPEALHLCSAIMNEFALHIPAIAEVQA